MKDPHRARRLALQGLCVLDVQGPQAADMVARFIDDSDEEPDTLAAARNLLKCTQEQLTECDRLLGAHAKNWDLSRLALVDRNILRLAVFELLGLSTPPKVVISEAMRLAREFSSGESPRFINGILDAVSREIKEETA